MIDPTQHDNPIEARATLALAAEAILAESGYREIATCCDVASDLTGMVASVA